MTQSTLFSLVSFDRCELAEANRLLKQWEHRMGPLHRGNQGAVCHVLLYAGEPHAVTTASDLIMEPRKIAPHITRESAIELSRLCAKRGGLCRVALRLWREFVFPTMGKGFAISYQDADLHSGNTYRFDGWQKIAFSRSGTDTRSGRPGRKKWIWQYPKLTDHGDETKADECRRMSE